LTHFGYFSSTTLQRCDPPIVAHIGTAGTSSGPRPKGFRGLDSRRVTDEEILAAYRANYNVPTVTLEQAKSHLTLERSLTQELVASDPDTRWETFERAYETLYAQLPWLKTTGGVVRTDHWEAVIGPPPRRVYEVGSGHGAMARALAARGYTVEATDITRERGHDHSTDGNPVWTVTDGVHLARFAENAPYDAVVSDQLVEHLHPDDIREHLVGCHEILRPGGVYAVQTPHAFTGPHDVSRCFGLREPIGMHLHEYTNSELIRLLRSVGFSRVCAIAYVPAGIPIRRPIMFSPAYARFLVALEDALSLLPKAMRTKVSRSLRGPIQPRIFMVATK
jgi:SAM-dependent methyltransferase